MGILRKGQKFNFYLHFHTLSPWTAGSGSLVVSLERGSHTGVTRPAAPVVRAGQGGTATYVWEEQLQLPATLYEDAAAARKGSGKGPGPFQRKELKLSVFASDSRGRPSGLALGTVTINLSDYAAADGRMQQSFAVVDPTGRSLAAWVASGPPKLLLTIGCRDAQRAGRGGPLTVEPSLSSSSFNLGSTGGDDDIPTTMSTDDEGSRPSSRADSRPSSRGDSRTGSRADMATRGNGALPSVPEEASGESACLGVRGAAAKAEAVAAAAQAARKLAQQQFVQGPSHSELYDADGFLIDESLDAELSMTEASGSVRRNLGSAMERAEESESASHAGCTAGSGTGPPEVQSRPTSGGDERQAAAAAAAAQPQAAATAAAQAAAPAANGHGAAAGLGVPAVLATPLTLAVEELPSPDPASMGPLSTLSAAGDPTVPFSLPPSTHHRRFASRDAGGGSGAGRRWAWRREGAGAGGGAAGRAGAAAAAGGGSIFQRARIASVSKHEMPAGAAVAVTAATSAGRAEGSATVEPSAHSASSAAPSSGTEPSFRRSTSEDAGAGQLAAAELAPAGASSAVSSEGQGQVQGPANLLSVAIGGGPSAVPHSVFAAAAAAGASGMPALQRSSHEAAARQHTQLALGSSALLSPTASALLDTLPSPDVAATAALSPFTSSLVAAALMQELRNVAALESAVYLAGGRRAFSGGQRHLHAPARRLARTILALGPQEGLGFGMQAMHAIEATAGAAAGDLHRLTFWWSNVLQLRWMFWTLCQGQGMGLEHAAAATATTSGSSSGGGFPSSGGGGGSGAGRGSAAEVGGATGRQGSGHLAARVLEAAASGLDWMQLLLPQLRELEGWLFAEMLKHLWWRVLLHGVTSLLLDHEQQQQQHSGEGPRVAGAAMAAASSGGGGGGGGSGLRTARSAPHLAAVGGDGSGRGLEDRGLGPVQGKTRSFESPEEEAVQCWVEALAGVQAALKDLSRPSPAPRAHLLLLHRHLITALLRRLDTLLFKKLLVEEGESPSLLLRLPSMSGQEAFSRSAQADEVLGVGGEAAALAALDPALLPFQRGPVTFSTGVNLKMAVSALTSWAADCGVKEEPLPQAARSTDMADYRLFPCLRSAADLLMMPKEVLTDRQIRREVVPGLPLHRVCQLLERFEPDECAPDPLPPGLLEALQSESPCSDDGGSPLSPTLKADAEYRPPDEATLLADGVIQPLSLEQDEESDEELESLAAAAQQHGGSSGALGRLGAAEELRSHRFALLHDLWAAAE